jgi:hypothetical protein
MAECPICFTPLLGNPVETMEFCGFACPRCGRWAIKTDPGGLELTIGRKIENNERPLHLRSRLSHILQRQQPNVMGSRWAEFEPRDLDSWHLDEPLPSPSEQLDALIIWIAEHQPSPAESARVKFPGISAWVGATITKPPSDNGVGWLLEQENAAEFIERRGAESGAELFRLKMSGWARYEMLKRRSIESKKVLMAMKFGDAELDAVVKDCFVPAVARTGFELRTLIQKQPAGLIDDQLRVALRTSRFVVADLTHGNNGAYWEAGFAEGLGRPVIYTCRKSEWKKSATHFDTNHLVTVIWDPADLDAAAEQLVATIRATLPDEARMSD